MSDNKKIKLSREEIAKIEIGHTEVSRGQKWFLTVFFLLFIGVYPIMQMFYHQPFGEWRNLETIGKSIKAFETAIEDTSLLRKWLLTPAQRFLLTVFDTGNEKVIVGEDGWLFFSEDYKYVINPGFMLPEKQQKKIIAGIQPDPVAAIREFASVLNERGIKLILVPVPSKPMIYSDMLDGKEPPVQNPSWEEFKKEVESLGVTVIDLAPEFASMRKDGVEPYLKTDTHWTPEGMDRCTAILAEMLDGSGNECKTITPIKHINIGDIAVMLKLPDCEKYFPAETVDLRPVDIAPDRNSDVLLLGDSFTNIYSVKALNWGTGSGLAEHLAFALGRPVDVIARNDAGAYATRQLLAQELRRGRDRLAGKNVVIWEFAMRELSNGDWKLMDFTLEEAPESNFVEVNSPVDVEATVLGVTLVPRPNSAPYKDHVMSILLGDVNNTNDQVLVYAASMVDNVWTPAAELRPGDRIKIHLAPWSDYEVEFGSWNRSEFEDAELLLAPPCWGAEIIRSN